MKIDNHDQNSEVVQYESEKTQPATINDQYTHAATSNNTRVAYQHDIADYINRAGPLPATAEQIKQYISTCALIHNPRTIKRRLTALRQWHKLQGLSDPTADPIVQKTMRGVARIHGIPKKTSRRITND